MPLFPLTTVQTTLEKADENWISTRCPYRINEYLLFHIKKNKSKNKKGELNIDIYCTCC